MPFEDIKGQESAIKILKENIIRDLIFSSYLFVGPESVGKFLTAKKFAKAINCQDKDKAPCEECSSCRKIEKRTHPDVFIIEPRGASHVIGIDQIRVAITQAGLKPYEARKKVFIINNAHTMNMEAANAFLKTLEEAPENTVFILVSRSKAFLPSTIVSRCHIIRFSTAHKEEVEKVLFEKFTLQKEEANILNNFSSGRIGEAVRMKEKGLIEQKNRIIDSILDQKSELLSELNRYPRREDLKESFDFLISYFRDIFLLKTINNEKYIFHIDRIDEIKKQCKRFSTEELDSIIKEIIKLRSWIDYNVNSRIIVDVLSNKVNKALRSPYA